MGTYLFKSNTNFNELQSLSLLSEVIFPEEDLFKQDNCWMNSISIYAIIKPKNSNQFTPVELLLSK
jgi:hypothetical protein